MSEKREEENSQAAVVLPWDEIRGPETEEFPLAEENEVEWVDENGRLQLGERWLIEKNR